jgi:hypothetical protein
MGLFSKFKRAVGLPNKFAVQEVKEDGKLRAVVLLSAEEVLSLGKAERQERFRRWRSEQWL